jgi:hypothetical protein
MLKSAFIMAVASVIALAQDVCGPSNDYIQSDGHPCSRVGTAKTENNKELNCHKNRFTAPQPQDFDQEVSLAALLAPGRDENRFDEEHAASFSGYVIDVKKGGNETCNCGAKNPIDMDTHIELGLAAGVPETQRVIVEVTPRFRKQMKEQGLDWSTEGLANQLKGKWVHVSGWLLFDSMHVGQAENTHPGNATNWRATCWEIHPITSINLLSGPPPEVDKIDANTLGALQRAHAGHVAKRPSATQAVESRIKRHRERFAPEEMEEADEETKERHSPESAARP